ncbi:DUF6279 family lipoprotein [Alteromonas sp. ASW11-36]|uniref:DUF6279 family lipoprotein n=1 Tax=Alteromonas arenosi TaxID=3055817 RepID=A0ABT7SXT8_9ALTE|nr:DUF6279 family lipoprotein [Alteromonas sp. ASW11-36]MDM7861011.1 DUF6279 family lipoprotein [Alteromonas sp. ASW11-36]
MRHVVFTVLLLITTTGCSSKFAYNNLDWLVYWYVDDYIEFSDQQEEQFDAKLATWLDWHRSEELNQYVAHLERVKAKALGEPMTPEEIAQEFDNARQHWERVRNKLSPELAQMAPLLTDDQVIYLFAALDKENRKEEEEREELDEQERLERRTESIIEQVEDMIGRITDDQASIIESYAPQFESTYDFWLTYRRDVQQAARQLFITRDSNPNFVAELTELMVNPDVYRTDQHVQTIERNRLLYATMVSELHTTLTDKQKRKLMKEMNAIIEDLEDLQS